MSKRRYNPTLRRYCLFRWVATNHLARSTADGQLARATYAPGHSPAAESFEWDGLALVQRGDEEFVNGPLSRSCIPRA